MCVCVCVCVCVCGRYHPYIWARWVVEIMKIWQLILIVSIVKILVWKPNSFLIYIYIYIYIYILITLFCLHSTHALNYTRNIKNKNKNLHTKHQKTFSSSFSRSLLNTGKLNSFLKNVLWKMNHFPKNVYAKTNRDRRSNSNVWSQNLFDFIIQICFGGLGHTYWKKKSIPLFSFLTHILNPFFSVLA